MWLEMVIQCVAEHDYVDAVVGLVIQKRDDNDDDANDSDDDDDDNDDADVVEGLVIRKSGIETNLSSIDCEN